MTSRVEEYDGSSAPAPAWADYGGRPCAMSTGFCYFASWSTLEMPSIRSLSSLPAFTTQRGPLMAQSTLEALLARGEPDSTAVIVPGEVTLTYAHLREAVHSAAGQLAEYGLGRSDRIAIVAPNSAEAI